MLNKQYLDCKNVYCYAKNDIFDEKKESLSLASWQTKHCVTSYKYLKCRKFIVAAQTVCRYYGYVNSISYVC